MPERSRRTVLRALSVSGVAGLAGCSLSGNTGPSDKSDPDTRTFDALSRTQAQTIKKQAAERRTVYQKFKKLYSREAKIESMLGRTLPDWTDALPTPRALKAIEEAQTVLKNTDSLNRKKVLRQGSKTKVAGDTELSEAPRVKEFHDDLAAKAKTVKSAAAAYLDDPSADTLASLRIALQDEHTLLTSANVGEVKEWTNIDPSLYHRGADVRKAAKYIRNSAQSDYRSLLSFRETVANHRSWVSTTQSTTEPGTTGTPSEEGPTTDRRQGYPMFQYDPANTGYAVGESGPTTDATPRWTARGSTKGVDGSPVVTGNTGYYVSSDGVVRAISLADGSEQWTFETGEYFSSTPAVVDGVVYVGGDVTAYALDAADGTERWRVEASGQPAYGVNTSPAVVQDSVYVTLAGGLKAIARADGSVRWTVYPDRPIGGAPAVADGTVYAGSWTNELYAFDATDGSKQWTFGTGEAVKSSPAVAGDTVYVGSEDGHVYAVSTADGSERWAFETRQGPTKESDDVQHSPVVADGTVYADNAEYLYALDAATGNEQWAVSGDDYVGDAPVVAGETVYVGYRNGVVSAFATSDGAEQWRFTTGEDVENITPTTPGGTGTPPDKIDANTTIQSSPTVADGTLYVGVEYEGNEAKVPDIYALSEP